MFVVFTQCRQNKIVDVKGVKVLLSGVFIKLNVANTFVLLSYNDL